MITQIKSQTRIAVVEFVTKLRADERLTQNVVVEVMNSIFGDSASGKWHWKQTTDLIEAAVVKMLLEDDFKSLEDVENLQSLIPHHQVRSQEQIKLQQFSTPLALAWIIGRIANGNKHDILLEPSAGTGILAAAYINGLSGDKPRRIILNEISPSRKALLRELFDVQHPVYSVNAEYINDTLSQGEQPNLILMNPPFSSSIGNSKRDPDCCMKHIRSALLRLEDYGRLVAIVPHWLSPEKQGKYFASLPAQLQLSLFVHGSHYRYHGTTMDARILVFDKVQPTEMPKSIDYTFSTSARDLRLLAANSCTHKIVVDYKGNPVSNPHKEAKPSDKPIEKVTDNSMQLFFTGLPLFQLQPTQQLEVIFKQISTIPNLAPAIKLVDQSPRFANVVQLNYQPATKAKSPMTDGIYAVYQGAITIAGATPHPSPVCESIAMAAIDPPHPTIEVNLPAAVIDKMQASDCQLETLIYACQAHSKFLDTPWYIAENGQIAVATPDNPAGKHHRMGYFVGANTGMGKSRIIALLILANWCEGRKKAVWVSKNDTLLPLAQANWMAVGGSLAQVVLLSKFAQDEPIRLSEGILFVTYGTLRSPAKGNKKSRVAQIIEWLGEDWDGVLSFDESHLMSNASGETSDRGVTNASAQALAGCDLVNRLPNARVTYLSATGAAKVSNLSYCQRLGLWGTQSYPFASRSDFISSIEDAGVAGLEMVAKDLKAVGLYLAPSLSFDGVKFETITHELTPEQRETWDTYAEAFRHIHHQMSAVLRAINLETESGKCTNGKAKANAVGMFESTKLRFFNALICAAKVPTLIDCIERDLAAGHACVVQLVSTGAASMERRLAEIPASEWGNMRAIDFTPKESIVEYLLTAFPIHLYQASQDEHGTIKSELMTDANGEPIISQEALAMRDGLIERMSMLPPVNSLLDSLNWHFGDLVAEVTGRDKRVIFKDGRYQLSQRSKSSNIAETNAFQNDEKRILVFSQSGAVGASYHADLKCKNQRLRRHYMLESGFSPTGVMQGLGRTHRANERVQPEIILVSTNICGELRFTSTISSKLSNLGAITRGQRDTGNNGLFNEETNNFSSQYAKSALGEFFADLRRSSIGGISLSEFCNYTGLNLVNENGQLLEKLPQMNTFLNRLLALPIGLQNILFGEFEERILTRIEQAKAAGSYERGVETLFSDGGFEVVETQILNTHSSGAETICYSIDKLNKPHILSFNSAQRIVKTQGFSFYRHAKTGNLALAGLIDKRIKRDGSTVDVIAVYHPASNKSWHKLDLPDFERNWLSETPTTQYWQQWQQLIDLAPEFIVERIYLICGLLLPIWKKLPDDNSKVFRLQTNDGRILLGRAIDQHQIEKVFGNFGLKDLIKLNAEDIFKLVWENHQVKSVGQWELQRNYYKGVDKLEVLAVYGSDKIDRLKAFGCFTEIIKSRTKVFIPLDKAVEIIDLLLTSQ
jgi:P-loop containing NTP hydrolase pore-1/C-terminal domain on Strawberry notch homologue